MSFEQSEDYSHDGSINSLLTAHGRKPFQPQYSKWVCHTSTIPLATTLDMEYARRKSLVTKVKSYFHGSTKESTRPPCPLRSCMFVNRTNHRANQHVPTNCPCLSVTNHDGEPLESICFLTFLKSLNRNLVNLSKEDEHRYIEPARVMFCQDSQGILDNQYPGAIRDATTISGWGHTSAANILEVLDHLYWYRTSKLKNRMERIFIDVNRRLGFEGFKRAIKQTLHTLNGLIVKKFFVFGPEISSYHQLADQTAAMFLALITEYSHDPALEIETPVYSELKDLFNYTKEIFYKGDITNRTSWLCWNFKHKGARDFFSSEFSRLRQTIDRMNRCENTDYSQSMAWFFRSTAFAQTRNMGYLPPHLAERKFAEFRDTVSRPLEDLTPEQDQLIRLAVVNRLYESGLPPGFLDQPRTEAEKEVADSVLSNVNLDIKGTASVLHKVAAGGKMEDARKAINRIKQHNWVVPVRSLATNEIVDYVGYDTDDDEAQWNRLLFWYSYQISLNWCAQRELLPEELYYEFAIEGQDDFELDILEASIVHIMEPGKVRDLVKSTGELTWALTPAAKILQASLALVPEHKAGLELAAHDWAHSRRISSESTEAGFIYDNLTGATLKNVLHVFKDWKQSTDYIGKRVGLAHLTSFAEYIGFPPAYLELVKILIREPQPVHEVVTERHVISTANAPDAIVREKVNWNGFIREGFMMGLPVTKPILHLIHMSEREVVKVCMEKLHLTIAEGAAGPPPSLRHIPLPRVPPENREIGRAHV